MEKKKKSKKKIIVAVIVAILLVLFILSRIAVNSIEEVPEFEEALVEKRTLTTTISSTGKIATETTKNVTSQLVNYKVTGVNVKVGDQVNVGDILCTFDTADLAKTVSDLSASIDATNQSSSISIASAERSVEDAERSKNSTLEDLKKQLNKTRL
jgi:multidrug efflux pump subunit AcrA (membrane-fusion protein)